MTSPAPNPAKRNEAAAKAPPVIAAAHEALIRDSFDDIALLVGSAAAIHNLDDDILWTVMKRLEPRDYSPLPSILNSCQYGGSVLLFFPSACRYNRRHTWPFNIWVFCLTCDRRVVRSVRRTFVEK